MKHQIAFCLALITLTLLSSCNMDTNPQTIVSKDSTGIKPLPNHYKAIAYIDSFINVNSVQINKNTALKEHYEGLCTKKMLPLIDKKGLYRELPFKLTTTTTHQGTAYGNFIYDDEKHFVKVTCIIKNNQLINLVEDSTYYIKFKTVGFESGVSFENEFSKIELPIVNGRLLSFKAVE